MTGRRRVRKVFNNSVVLAVDAHGTESVLLGRGVGFQAAPGDEVDPGSVEREFLPGPRTPVERVASYLAELPLEDVELTEEIVAAARAELGDALEDHVLFPLADHLSFAVRRAREGMTADYPLRWEIASLYPRELRVGRRALEIVEQRRGVRLAQGEAALIALHLVNAQHGGGDMPTTMRTTEALSEALDVVAEGLGSRIDEDSVAVSRFVTHLRYLIVRRLRGIESVPSDAAVREAVRAARPLEYATAGRIADALARKFGWDVDEHERLYLTLHVARLVASPVQITQEPAGG